MDLALDPALEKAGLPLGAATLVKSVAHASGWAMFSDDRLSLAVARGSGHAVNTLGSLARRAGVSTSLHGTGGAWIVASENADNTKFSEAVFNSLDRKVCNSLNTCCIQRSRADELVGVFLDSMTKAGEGRNHNFKLHVVEGDESLVPDSLFGTIVPIGRAEGLVDEPQAQSISRDKMGDEWEWEKWGIQAPRGCKINYDILLTHNHPAICS